MAAVFFETNPDYVGRRLLDCGIASNNSSQIMTSKYCKQRQIRLKG